MIQEDVMPYIAKPIDRDQVMIMTFDSLVECNSIARVIDHFVNNIDLAGMGFKNAVPSFEGRPGYPAECMVKQYLYILFLQHAHSTSAVENVVSLPSGGYSLQPYYIRAFSITHSCSFVLIS